MAAMRKHGSRSALAMPEAPVQTSFVSVDYPQEKEVVTSFEYTFRIGAGPDVSRVEVSIDGGQWQPCRESVGFWWYDWSGYAAKAARQLSARATTQDGRIVESQTRRFSVKLPKPAGAAAPKAAAKAPRARKKLTRSLAVEA